MIDIPVGELLYRTYPSTITLYVVKAYLRRGKQTYNEVVHPARGVSLENSRINIVVDLSRRLLEIESSSTI